MGKKSRRKRDKRQNRPIQATSQPVAAVQAMPSHTPLGDRLASGAATKKPATEIDYGYVRTDIRRILWLIGGVVVVMVAVVLIDNQTGFFTELGGKLARGLRLI